MKKFLKRNFLEINFLEMKFFGEMKFLSKDIEIKLFLEEIEIFVERY
jgi:hypothetical protein